MKIKKLNNINKKSLGFTLIELMITVAIVGVLASIAYPSYTAFVTQSNRTEGQRALLRFANLQEQYFVDYRTYGNLMVLGKASTTVHYDTSIAASDLTATTFIIKATAKNSQANNDAACSPLTINEVGQKGPAGCW